jgi:hypothetical protein
MKSLLYITSYMIFFLCKPILLVIQIGSSFTKGHRDFSICRTNSSTDFVIIRWGAFLCCEICKILFVLPNGYIFCYVFKPISTKVINCKERRWEFCVGLLHCGIHTFPTCRILVSLMYNSIQVTVNGRTLTHLYDANLD